MSRKTQIRKAWLKEHAGWNKEGWQKGMKAVTPLALPLMRISGYPAPARYATAVAGFEFGGSTG
jgi:hypothetical protein